MNMAQARIEFDDASVRRVASGYARRWKVGLCAVRPDGAVTYARAAGKFAGAAHRAARRTAVEESLRWGEPFVQLAPGDLILWAVPLMRNSQLTGGLVAGIAEGTLFPAGTPLPVIDVRQACAELLALVESHNLTNASLLESRRLEHQRERQRAEAIHQYKATPLYDLRALYLIQEPLLMGAIRRGDRPQARAILNQLLVGMIHRAGKRLDVAKAFFMELVATMSRTAIEAGGAPEELLGNNYESLTRLARITSDQHLAPWLHAMLERIMDSIRDIPAPPEELAMVQAIRLMGHSCASGDAGRDRIAQQVGLSPAHFSRCFKRHFGRPFTQVLMQMRADRAAEFLARSQKPLKLIAIDCGFSDQSHLTKVFRRLYGKTPAQYRAEHRFTKV